MTRAELSHLADRLRKMPPKARAATPGLNPDRADIIVAGLVVVDRLMQRFHLNVLQVHNRGIRDGLLLAMIERSPGSVAAPVIDRHAAIDRFAAECRTDLEHGRHVARLAGEIYRQLAAPLGLDPTDQPLLEAAARLQDVGYLINYDQHHKHSYHLVLNSNLPGFQPHELELVANVARYHRGARPKKKHANFRQLTAVDRWRVKRLAAILRLAGGLDRSHSQQVTAVDATAGPSGVDLCVHSADDPDVDLWGARRRTRLFEEVFDAPVRIEWERAEAGPGEKTERPQDS